MIRDLWYKFKGWLFNRKYCYTCETMGVLKGEVWAYRCLKTNEVFQTRTRVIQDGKVVKDEKLC
jgi:hypothetical protein